jgi:hypothetical protein
MHPRSVLVCSSVLALAAVAAFQPAAWTQPQQTHEQRAEEFRQRSLTFEKTGLAEPFKGITTAGSVQPGLFAIKSTGVSTEPVRRAAEKLLGALTAPQRDKTTFSINADEWRKWMNQDFYARQGVSFLEMTEAQRQAALDLLKAGLSAKGLTQTRDIMRLNHTLAEMDHDDFDRYGEWRYHLTVMGTPSATEPWGWQLDGHHAIINYFVLGDQVVMTPFFAGSEPVVAASGKYKGTSVLQDEQSSGLKMIRALTDAQRAKAILKVSKTGNENLTEAWKDNVVLDYAGLRVADMTEPQRQQLVALMALYIDNMDEGHARVKMAEVRAHLDQTWFAWIGRTDDGGVFYYRVHSPVVLIEFDHQVPANLKAYAKDPNAPNPQHIHTVVRTPNGNDYGKDLLRQHYLQHPHATAVR